MASPHRLKVYFLEASDLKFKSVKISHVHFLFTNKPPRGMEIKSSIKCHWVSSVGLAEADWLCAQPAVVIL